MKNDDMQTWQEAFNAGKATLQEWAHATTAEQWEAAQNRGEVTIDLRIDAHIYRLLQTQKEREDIARETLPEGSTKGDVDLAKTLAEILKEEGELSAEKQAIEAALTSKEITAYDVGTVSRNTLAALSNEVTFIDKLVERAELIRSMQTGKQAFEAGTTTLQQWALATTGEAWKAAYAHGDVPVELRIDAHVYRWMKTKSRQQDWLAEKIPEGQSKDSYDPDKESDDISRQESKDTSEKRAIEAEVNALKEPEKYEEESIVRRSYRALRQGDEDFDDILSSRAEQFKMQERPLAEILQTEIDALEAKIDGIREREIAVGKGKWAVLTKKTDEARDKWHRVSTRPDLLPMQKWEAQYQLGRQAYLRAAYSFEQEVLNKKSAEPSFLGDVNSSSYMLVIDKRLDELSELESHLSGTETELFEPDIRNANDESEAYRRQGTLALCGYEKLWLEEMTVLVELRAATGNPNLTNDELQGNVDKQLHAEAELEELGESIQLTNFEMSRLEPIAAKINQLESSGPVSGEMSAELEQLKRERAIVGIRISEALLNHRRQVIQERTDAMQEQLDADPNESLSSSDTASDELMDLDDEFNALGDRYDLLAKRLDQQLLTYCNRLQSQVDQLMVSQKARDEKALPVLPELALRLAQLSAGRAQHRLTQTEMEQEDVSMDSEERGHYFEERRLTTAYEKIQTAVTRLSTLEKQSEGKGTRPEIEGEKVERDMLHAELTSAWVDYKLEKCQEEFRKSGLDPINDSISLQKRIDELADPDRKVTATDRSSEKAELALRQRHLKLLNEQMKWKAAYTDNSRLHQLSERIAKESRRRDEVLDPKLSQALQEQLAKAKEVEQLNRSGGGASRKLMKELLMLEKETRTTLLGITVEEIDGRIRGLSRERSEKETELRDKRDRQQDDWMKRTVEETDSLKKRLAEVQTNLNILTSGANPIFQKWQPEAEAIQSRLEKIASDAESIDQQSEALCERPLAAEQLRGEWNEIGAARRQLDEAVNTEQQAAFGHDGGSPALASAPEKNWKVADLEKVVVPALLLQKLRQQTETLNDRMGLLVVTLSDTTIFKALVELNHSISKNLEAAGAYQKQLMTSRVGPRHQRTNSLDQFSEQLNKLEANLHADIQRYEALESKIADYEMECLKQMRPDSKAWTPQIAKKQAELIAGLVERGSIPESPLNITDKPVKLRGVLCVCNAEGKMQLAVWETAGQLPTVYGLNDNQRRQVEQYIANHKSSLSAGDVRNLTIHPETDRLTVKTVIRKVSDSVLRR